MSFFSRLTDIVTCNLTQILEEEADPKAALAEILREMEEGLAGATRSVKTAVANEQRINDELSEHKSKIDYWVGKAKEALADGDESSARGFLVRKQEVEDLIAGLEQQLKAAEATRVHLTTTLRALEARLAEARRKDKEMAGESTGGETPAGSRSLPTSDALNDARAAEVDAQLEALKREVGG